MAEQKKHLVAIWELPPGIARKNELFFWVYMVEAGFEMESACGLKAQAESIQGLLAKFNSARQRRGGSKQDTFTLIQPGSPAGLLLPCPIPVNN